MTENVQSQTIDFAGELKNAEKFKEVEVMDAQMQNAIVELNKNYNKMVNNMFYTCAKMCIKKFDNPNLMRNEQVCVENCQKKFYKSYSIGHRFMADIMREVEKVDLFSDKSEVDIVKSRKNI